MSCNNYCSRNYSSGSLRNSCHVPVTSSFALCPTSVGYGDAVCLPSTCQGSTWILDNCHGTCSDPTKETCGEPTSCQPAICEPSNCETSCCSSTAYYVPRPCQGSSFLPASSYNHGSCFPVPYRPLNYGPSSCRPLRPLLYSFQPLGYAPSGYRPLNSFSHSCRPLSLLTYGHQPLGCLAGGPQSLSFVPSSLRPLQPLSRGCQPLTPVVSTCHPSCYAVGSC
ncbi:keratin-associated protein 26-1-like [Choloepus didactylus]|uniref:keratin-associated protein 26-1-like n=1 Tax=Choloepus didactylus TaxID=27675 RepID=UPI00189EFF7F|nr:keratin-associated protein 26-1-like [Choloepus didactylus]